MSIKRRIFLIATDMMLILGSLLLALVIRFEGDVPEKYLEPNLLPYVSLCFISAGILWLLGLYNKLWRYASIQEGIHLFNAITLSFVIFGIPVFVLKGYFYPRGVVIIAWLLAILLLGGVRLLLRMVSSKYVMRHRGRKVIVVGGGDAGETVIRDLQRNPSEHWPVGILDDEEPNRSIRIHGVPIIGTRSDLPRLIAELAIKDVVITHPSPAIVKEVVELCKGLSVEFKTIPGVHELMNGKMKLSPIREIRIEDLLGREPVQVRLDSIKSYLYGKSVLVTGAGGSIGSELCRQIIAFEPSLLTLLGHGENSIYEIFLELSNRFHSAIQPVVADIRHVERMREVFKKVKPEIVFHAAAHKHVPFMEIQPFEALTNNFLATCSLSQLSLEFGVKKFIFLSTDKSVQPESVMGATKRLSEMYLQALNVDLKTRTPQPMTQFISARFGNVLDSRGSVVPTFRKQILMGGPVTVTHPQMTRYFMTIPEAVQLVLQAAALGNGGELFLLDMGRPVNILELAQQMIRLAGYEPDKDIPIQVVGPRPGEKLTEKLYGDHEVVEPTAFEKILLVRSRSGDYQEFSFRKYSRAAGEMEELCRKEDELSLIALLGRLIPEYARPEEARRNR